MHSQLSVEVGAVLYVDVITLGMLSHPCPILIDVCGIDDDKKVVFTHLIHEQVIYRSTILIAHHAIENLSRFHSPNIVGKDMVDVSLGIWTLDSHLAHVGHIEHSTGIAHSLVLVLDVGILDRHVESAKWTDQCSKSNMLVVKTRSFIFFHSLNILIFNYCLSIISRMKSSFFRLSIASSRLSGKALRRASVSSIAPLRGLRIMASTSPTMK